MTSPRHLLAALTAAFLIAPAALAQAPAAPKPQQFLYVLKVAPHLYDEAK